MTARRNNIALKLIFEFDNTGYIYNGNNNNKDYLIFLHKKQFLS